MSQPMASFIDNDDESNQAIADKIVAYFNDRDDGSYAAIVSETRPKAVGAGMVKTVHNCRGRYIRVWKQLKSPEPLKLQLKGSTLSALVKGLILEHDNCAAIYVALQEVLGGYWSAVKDNGDVGIAYSHDESISFKKLKVGEGIWTVWRYPR